MTPLEEGYYKLTFLDPSSGEFEHHSRTSVSLAVPEDLRPSREDFSLRESSVVVFDDPP